MFMDHSYIQIRLENLKRELQELEKRVSYSNRKRIRTTNLKGLWKGTDISEADICAAKKSLFKEIFDIDL